MGRLDGGARARDRRRGRPAQRIGGLDAAAERHRRRTGERSCALSVSRSSRGAWAAWAPRSPGACMRPG
ncbi:hypothetical protein BLAT2472_30423 [Burkholderia latens]